MIENTKAITISSYLCMFFIGIGSTILGAAARNIGLTPYQIGLLLSIQNLGFFFSVTASGALSDTYEKPKILLFGSIILALSFFLFYLWPSFLLNLLIMFFIGIGSGTYEGVTDPMLLDIHREKESLYININHFFVTFGSFMITLYLIFLQMNWRNSIIQSSVAVLLLSIFFALAKLKKESNIAKGLAPRFRFLKKKRIVAVFFLATICTVGLEIGLTGIITTFLMELRGFTQVTSKIGLLIFLSGIAAGRILIGFLTKKNQMFTFIILLFGLSSIFFSGLFLVNIDGSMLPILISIFLCGATVSAIFPLTITLAGLMFKDMSGTVLGIIKMALPVGGILIPFLLSLISKYISFQISLLIFPFIALFGFFILLLNMKKIQPQFQ